MFVPTHSTAVSSMRGLWRVCTNTQHCCLVYARTVACLYKHTALLSGLREDCGVFVQTHSTVVSSTRGLRRVCTNTQHCCLVYARTVACLYKYTALLSGLREDCGVFVEIHSTVVSSTRGLWRVCTNTQHCCLVYARTVACLYKHTALLSRLPEDCGVFVQTHSTAVWSKRGLRRV